VIGKALGIGLAGATQTTIVLVPRSSCSSARRRSPGLVLGQGSGSRRRCRRCRPGCCSGFALFYVLGFALYSLVYAAAGSLVSRPEDLQIIALPLSIVAIAGYGMGCSR
jgi:ABC-2 type transport system permease protein